MRRFRLSSSVLVALLVLLLPLEQGHSAWMGLQSHATRAAAMPPGHECCAPTSAPQPERPAPTPSEPQGCLCLQLPAGAMPTVLATGASTTPVSPIAEIDVPPLIAPPAITHETVPALDIGSPPLPEDPGAHGLRAPPSA